MSAGEFSGRTALVTGGSRGIGRAICLMLARGGAKVAINYVNDASAAAEVKALIEADGGKAITVQGDVSDADVASALVTESEAALGPISLLVCNAGISRTGSEDPLSYANWRRILDVNLDGTFLSVMALKDAMMARGDGRIVCIASIAGLRARARSVAYATSKAAVIAFVRNISGVLAPDVRINAIAPGLVETDMIAPMDAEVRQGMVDGTPMKRVGRPEEIAEMTRFLLSDQSSFTTGQTLVASGGRETVP